MISSAEDDALSPEQLYQQLLWARDDIQLRDSTLHRLQLKHAALETSFEQVLTSSSELLGLHAALLEQHLDLNARQQECASALSSCQTKLLAADHQFQQSAAQLLETRAKYDKLAAQLQQEDDIVRSSLLDIYSHHFAKRFFETRPHLRPKTRPSY
jgi:hypothetical protein